MSVIEYWRNEPDFFAVFGIVIVMSYLKQLSYGFVVLQWIWVNVKTDR